jgi:hypothetical protein
MFSARMGFEYTSGNNPNAYWFDAIDLKCNGASASTTTTIKNINNNSYIFGRGNSSSTGLYRPYFAKLNDSVGLIDTYVVFPDVNSFSSTNNVTDILVDGSNNTHVIFNKAILQKYDSNNNFVTGIDLSSLGTTDNMVIDNTNNIYVLIYNGTVMNLLKIDSSTYSITWYKIITLTTSDTNQLLIDPSGNLYITAYSGSSPYNYIIKLDNTGSILWQKSLAYTSTTSTLLNRVCFDSSNNIYLINQVGGYGYVLVKINSVGTKVYEYTVTDNTSLGTSGYRMIINGSGNLALMSTAAGNVGGYISVITTTPSALYTTYYTNDTSNFYPLNITCSSTNLYVEFTLKNAGTRVDGSNFKLPNNGNLTGLNKAYSYTVTSDDSTNYTFSGTITSSSDNVPTFSTSTKVTLSNSSATIASGSISPSTVTQSLNTVTPFSYGITLP